MAGTSNVLNYRILRKEDLNYVCRCCLSKDQTTTNIFELKYEETWFSEIMNSLLCTKVNIDDEMPKNICEKCISEIVQFYNFKKICNVSKDIFKTLISGTTHQLTSDEIELILQDCENLKDDSEIVTNVIKNGDNNDLIKKLNISNTTTDIEDNSDYFTEKIIEEDSLRENVSNDSFTVQTSNKDIKNSSIPQILLQSTFDEINLEDGEKAIDDLDIVEYEIQDGDKDNLNNTSSISNTINIKGGDDTAENITEGDFITTVGFTGLNNDNDQKNNSTLSADSSYYKKKLYECNICFLKVSCRGNLTRHMRKHTGEKPYICDICGKAFSQHCTLMGHRRIHTGEKSECNICFGKFSSDNSLRTHKKTHTGERPHVCQICGKSFIQHSSLVEHKKIHTGEKPYVCEFCGKGFVQRSHFICHTRSHTGEQPYLCIYCGKRYRDRPSYKLHLEQHEGKQSANMRFQCRHCNEAFPTRNILRTHMMRHGEKKFLCSDCGKRFYRESTLLLHSRVHTGEKPYTCSLCSKSFSHNATLKTHMLTHTGDKPFACEVCSQTFRQRQHLRKHLKTHTGDRTYSCRLCNKTFNDTGNLTIHMRTHTGETPYVCDVCSKGFHDSTRLKRHKKQHVVKIKGE